MFRHNPSQHLWSHHSSALSQDPNILLVTTLLLDGCALPHLEGPYCCQDIECQSLPECKEHHCLDAQELAERPDGLKLVLESMIEHNQTVQRPHLQEQTAQEHSRSATSVDKLLHANLQDT